MSCAPKSTACKLRTTNSASRPGIGARFNDGRFRVTTEAKLRPLARFGCSMVSRLAPATGTGTGAMLTRRVSMESPGVTRSAGYPRPA